MSVAYYNDVFDCFNAAHDDFMTLKATLVRPDLRTYIASALPSATNSLSRLATEWLGRFFSAAICSGKTKPGGRASLTAGKNSSHRLDFIGGFTTRMLTLSAFSLPLGWLQNVVPLQTIHDIDIMDNPKFIMPSMLDIVG